MTDPPGRGKVWTTFVNSDLVLVLTEPWVGDNLYKGVYIHRNNKNGKGGLAMRDYSAHLFFYSVIYDRHKSDGGKRFVQLIPHG